MLIYNIIQAYSRIFTHFWIIFLQPRNSSQYCILLDLFDHFCYYIEPKRIPAMLMMISVATCPGQSTEKPTHWRWGTPGSDALRTSILPSACRSDEAFHATAYNICLNIKFCATLKLDSPNSFRFWVFRSQCRSIPHILTRSGLFYNDYPLVN